ncbi:MAG: hypothetical protein ACD_29C00451G0002 [uncultured bacterium]|nr:MAG: hypothetical protein ACD_29C00451G0002 [uncultured bacterium]
MNIHSDVATCDRHNKHFTWSIKKMANFMPITSARFANLSEEEFAILELFSSRFGKLQDTMGTKIFPAILELTQEPGVYPTFIDKLNRLEKIGAIPSSADWQIFRKIRNQFSHEYPDDPKLNAALLNRAYEQGKILQKTFEHVKQFIAEKIK